MPSNLLVASVNQPINQPTLDAEGIEKPLAELADEISLLSASSMIRP